MDNIPINRPLQDSEVYEVVAETILAMAGDTA
jgi:hypothetical protein